MRTIAVVNQKGGCGKTTVSINLASALASFGKKTLLVDMDPQSHCAVGLAVPEEQIEQSIYDVLISKSRNEPIHLSEILWQITENLELAPSSLDLSSFEGQMVGVVDREQCLANVLTEIQEKFEYVVIDCPPAVGLLTYNALTAATDVVVPVETGYFALHGLSKQLETLNSLCAKTERKINVRVVASMYDIRTKMAREILSELRKHFGEHMYKTTVNFNTKIKEAASYGQPVSEYDPSSKGNADFKALAREVIGVEMRNERRELVNSLASQLESISSSADELLATTREAMQMELPQTQEVIDEEAVACAVAQAQNTASAVEKVEEQISNYYGVTQVNQAVTFTSLYPRAESVQIAGDFNNWQPENTPMQKISECGKWHTKLDINPGIYRYRLVVDGQWQQDPYNDRTEMNPYGDLNSVLEVN